MAEYVGTPGFGLFKDTSAIELGALAAKEALRRSEINPADVRDAWPGIQERLGAR